MRVGWVGLGKLGFPCALAASVYGEHKVHGYDPTRSEAISKWLRNREPYPYKEELMEELLISNSKLEMHRNLSDVVANSDLIFVSVQTPHTREYGGEIPVPRATADFEYWYLRSAISAISHHVRTHPERQFTVAIISTVLPGTIDRVIKSIIPDNVALVYNPFFIAMGTTINDFMEPEFVLIGIDETGTKLELAKETLLNFYDPFVDGEIYFTSIANAELVKVSYNTFISMKIVFANTIMEICDKTSADCDEVINILSKADKRIISPAYLRGGMGDGGACHPRDNIAMSHLAERLDLSFDLMGTVAKARDAQTAWMATHVMHWHKMSKLPIVVLGRSFKPESDIETGSPALLLAHMLRLEHFTFYHLEHMDPNWKAKALFVIATMHEEFAKLEFPAGSIIIDPFGYIPENDSTMLVRIGRK